MSSKWGEYIFTLADMEWECMRFWLLFTLSFWKLRNNSLLQLRASVEQLHQQLYAIHEVMGQLNTQDDTHNAQVEAWVGHVQTPNNSTDVRPEDIAIRNRLWEL